MNKKILAMLAVGLLGGSLTAQAVPIKYDMIFEADSGPGGVGSFFWDSEVGAITDFMWSLGGGAYIGGSQFGTAPVFGGTHGEFVFEMLSQTDVHPADCIFGGCSTSGPFTGSGPPGASDFLLASGSLGSGSADRASYFFRDGFLTNVATGLISVTPTSVPEPGTLALLLVGFAGVGVMRRKRST